MSRLWLTDSSHVRNVEMPRAAEVLKIGRREGCVLLRHYQASALWPHPVLRMTSLVCWGFVAAVYPTKGWNQRFPILENVVLLITLGSLHFDIRTTCRSSHFSVLHSTSQSTIQHSAPLSVSFVPFLIFLCLSRQTQSLNNFCQFILR